MEKVILLIEITQNEEIINKKVLARKEIKNELITYNFVENNIYQTTYKIFKEKFEIININNKENTEVKIILMQNGNSEAIINFNNQELKTNIKILKYQTNKAIDVEYILEIDPENIHHLKVLEKR